MSLSSGFRPASAQVSDVQNLLQQVGTTLSISVSTRNLTNAFGSSYLYGGWSPGYEVGQLALSDPLEALVHLGRVHLTLHNNREHEKHKSMRIVVGGWNQVPSDIKKCENGREASNPATEAIELNWRLQPRWRRTRVQDGDLKALDTDTPQQVNK
jgi:hypothetical protein